MKTIWKIVIGAAAFLILIFVLAYFGTKGVSDIAKDTLKDIQAQDMAKAYALTSTAFQKVTTLDAFKTFVAKYPILQNYKTFTVASQEVTNDTGKVIGNLTDTSGVQTAIQFGLVKENKEWRVLSIDLGSSATSTTTATTTASATSADTSSVFGILVSDTADSSGYVSATKTVVSQSAAHIYATAQISSALAGTVATSYLVFEGSGEEVGPIDNPIDQSGDILKAFSFTNTAGAWPVGTYSVNVTLTNGETKTVQFQVQ